jgi:hypothetical protein
MFLKATTEQPVGLLGWKPKAAIQITTPGRKAIAHDHLPNQGIGKLGFQVEFLSGTAHVPAIRPSTTTRNDYQLETTSRTVSTASRQQEEEEETRLSPRSLATIRSKLVQTAPKMSDEALPTGSYK